MSDKIIDSAYVYTTPYTDFEKYDCLQKTMVIPGKEGKKIDLEEIELQLSSSYNGVKATVRITDDISGKETTLADFSRNGEGYTSMGVKINRDFISEKKTTSEVGKGVTLKWYLKTSSKTYRARMKDLSCTYSYVDAEVVEPDPEPEPTTDPKSIIVIECLESETAALIEKISGIAPGAEIYTKKG